MAGEKSQFPDKVGKTPRRIYSKKQKQQQKSNNPESKQELSKNSV